MVQAAFGKKRCCPQHSGPLTMEPQLSDIALSRVHVQNRASKQLESNMGLTSQVLACALLPKLQW